MDIDELNKIKILHRLKKIEGQIRGIQSMLLDSRSCSDILMQIAAVHSALNRINKLILEEKINSFFNITEDVSQYQNNLDEIIELIIKFIK